MKKRLFIIALCTGLSLVLSGCFPDGKPVAPDASAATGSQNASAEPGAVPSTLQRELADGVTIDAVISIPDTDFSHAYTAVPWIIEHEKLKEIFLTGREDIRYEEQRHPITGEIIYRGYYADDGSTAAINYEGNQNAIFFGEKVYGDYPYTLSMYAYEGWIRPGFREKFPLETLENIDREEAVALVREKLDALNIPVLDTPEVYCLDLEHLQIDFEANWKDFENPKYPDGKHPEWKKEYEAYVIVFQAVLPNASPVTQIFYQIQNDTVYGNHYIGVVGKTGLIFFQVSGAYTVQEEQVLAEPILSLEAACERAAAIYNGFIPAGHTEIWEISLEYLPRRINADGDEYELAPTWIFQGTEEIPDGKGSTFNKDTLLLIDAVTGEEIPNEGAM